MLLKHSICAHKASGRTSVMTMLEGMLQRQTHSSRVPAAAPVHARMRVSAPATRPSGAQPTRSQRRGGSVAAGQSLEVSFGTGDGNGRTGAAQLREETVEAVRAASRAPLDAAATSEDAARVLRETAEYLKGELERIFTTGAVTRQRYADDITFQDPVARYKGRDAYIANIQLLNSLFDITFVTLSLHEQEPDRIHTRRDFAKWTMELNPRFLPWRPTRVLTGTSKYTVNPCTGQITSHMDTWDALADNSYFSLEGLALVIRSFATVQLTPDLETPRYTVLRKVADYEIRRYEAYLVAEVAMPEGSGPAAGDGFNELAGYIFGGNSQSTKMEMTTPVFSSAGSPGGQATMQFPMESRFGGGADALPTPSDARVTRKLEEGRTVAAYTFSGLPLDWEVRYAERRLRGALLLDGLRPEEGYHLARYNDPFTPPPLRRNEVLIRLPEGFEP